MNDAQLTLTAYSSLLFMTVDDYTVEELLIGTPFEGREELILSFWQKLSDKVEPFKVEDARKLLIKSVELAKELGIELED